MTDRMTADELRLGGIYALAHCAQLIEDAALLYSQERVASSFVLCVSAREELGRCQILWNCANKLAADQALAHNDLVRKLDDHVVKLKAGQFTTTVPLSQAQVTSFSKAIESGDLANASVIATEIRASVKRKQKRDPHDLHGRRLKAQYVDPQPDGSWSRPSEIGNTETLTLIQTVMTEIASVLIATQTDSDTVRIAAQADTQIPSMELFMSNVLHYLQPA